MHRIGLLLLLLPGVASAEVGDKVASIPALWWQAAAIGVVGLLAGRYRSLLGCVVLLFAGLFAWAGVSTLNAPFIGGSLAHEFAGRYALAVYGSSTLMLGLVLLGTAWGWRRGGLPGDRERPDRASGPKPLRGSSDMRRPGP